MSWSNFHGHCHYCDGSGTVHEHVEAAINLGFHSLAITCHGPLPFDNEWCMKAGDLASYRHEVGEEQKRYGDRIELYFGYESDYIPGISDLNSDYLRQYPPDFTLCSVHFVEQFPEGRPWEIDGSHETFSKGLRIIFGDDLQRCVKRYFELTREMVQYSCPDIIGHLDKIKMQNTGGTSWNLDAPWYREEIMETLTLIREKGAIIEINTRGLYTKRARETYPGVWTLRRILEMGIPVCLNSDSHNPSELALDFESTAEVLAEIGFRELHTLRGGHWQALPFDQNGFPE